MVKSTGSSTGSYVFKEYKDGTVYVQTSVSWSRYFGKCNLQRFNKSGEIYTRSRFKAWCKKYNITPTDEEINRLPTTIWG